MPSINRDNPASPLAAAWALWATMFAALGVYLFIALQFSDRFRVAADPSIPIRTLFYCIAIGTFPLMNWLRRFMLRRRTAARADAVPRHAFRRYLQAVTVSLALAEGVGVLGLTLFILGDTLQTLIIFIFMSAFGMVLYSPKREEYLRFRRERD